MEPETLMHAQNILFYVWLALVLLTISVAFVQDN